MVILRNKPPVISAIAIELRSRSYQLIKILSNILSVYTDTNGLKIVILEKLIALSWARKAIRNQKPSSEIIDRLLQSSYFKSPQLQSSPKRRKISLERILQVARERESKEVS